MGKKIVGGVSNMMGELTGANATRSAMQGQSEAAALSNQTQKYMFDEQRKDMQPWREAGIKALTGLQGDEFQKDFTMNDFQADPGYAFRMEEANKAIERSAAARGGLNSGATMKALTKYNQDAASQEYQNAYNRFNADRDRRFGRLSSLAGVGQDAQSTINQAGTNYANNISATQQGLGNANAAALINQSGANRQMIGQGMQAGTNALMLFSDERLKINCEPISKEDLQELRQAIKPYLFNYVDDSFGAGDWIGVMAQDLEKSKLGKRLVVENEKGEKMIDLTKAVSLLLATMAEVA